MPILPFEIITLVADFLIFIFVGYYLIKFHTKEKELERKEGKVDTEYHQVIDTALSKERKILEDATAEADHIITGAEYITKTSKDEVNHALQQIAGSIQQDAKTTAQTFMQEYGVSLKQLAATSLTDMQGVVKELETDLHQQIKTFHDTLLPTMKAELEEYKKARMQETEQVVTRVVQTVSQEVLHKSISLADHQNLLIDSLEKAKKTGVFD